MSLCVGSVSSYMKDYSIAYPGPSERTFRVWEMAERRGLKTAAKIQLNNSWEGAAVPYIPALNLVDLHLRNLLDAKVRSVVVSWTLGGCPSTPNLLRLRDFIWKTEGAPRSLLDFARAVYGEGASGKVCMAWKLLSDALQKFPHNIPVLYYSPLHMGPANLLYSSYSDYRATMVSFPYNDLSRWRGIYTEDIFVEQFKKLSEDWAKGVDLLDGIEPPANRRQRAALKDLTGVARANYCHFRTTCLQACFIIQRDRLYRLAGLDGIIRKNPERAEVIKGILAILAEEIELAKTLRLLARHDSRLGFEATQHYYYRAEDLMEKVLNCEALSDYFKRLLEEATR